MPRVENGVQTKRQDRQRVVEAAYELYYRDPAPDWVTFFRKILGLNGIVRKTYRTPEELAEFKHSDAYAELLQMLTRLREQAAGKDSELEPIRVITVRVPSSVHEAIRGEAYQHEISMNQLCISKLLQFIDGKLIPKEQWKKSAETDAANQEEQEDVPTAQGRRKKVAVKGGAGADL